MKKEALNFLPVRPILQLEIAAKKSKNPSQHQHQHQHQQQQQQQQQHRLLYSLPRTTHIISRQKGWSENFTVATMAFAKSKYHLRWNRREAVSHTSRVLTHGGDRRFLRNKDDDDHDENDDDVPHWAEHSQFKVQDVVGRRDFGM